MSICTKRGDEGQTDLMFGRRVSKTHARVEACGAADELNAVFGIVRNSNVSDEMKQWVDEVHSVCICVRVPARLSTHYFRLHTCISSDYEEFTKSTKARKGSSVVL